MMTSVWNLLELVHMKFDDIKIYSQIIEKQIYERINATDIQIGENEKQKSIKCIDEFLHFIGVNIGAGRYTLNDLFAAREYFVHNRYADFSLKRKEFVTVEEFLNDSNVNFFVIRYDGNEIDVDDFNDVEQYCTDAQIDSIEWISENDPPKTWLKIL